MTRPAPRPRRLRAAPVHLEEPGGGTACGRRAAWRWSPDPNAVTCRRCRQSIARRTRAAAVWIAARR